MAGTSLSAYLLEQITAQASIPTPQEIMARLERLEPVTPKEHVVDALHRARDAR